MTPREFAQVVAETALYGSEETRRAEKRKREVLEDQLEAAKNELAEEREQHRREIARLQIEKAAEVQRVAKDVSVAESEWCDRTMTAIGAICSVCHEAWSEDRALFGFKDAGCGHLHCRCCVQEMVDRGSSNCSICRASVRAEGDLHGVSIQEMVPESINCRMGPPAGVIYPSTD